MAGPIKGGGPEGTDDREETPPPLTKEPIEGHVSTLKSLVKSHNRRNKGDPIRLDFELEDTEVHDHNIAKGKGVMDEDLGKPFNEARRTPLTRRIIDFAGPEYKMPTNIKLYDGTTDPEDHLSCFASAANSGKWHMPVWCCMFQQTLNGSAKGWFECLPHNNINEWADMIEAFAAKYSVRRACFKEPREITKIVRKANESLTKFKEKWKTETGFIMGVPEVMKISSFMDSVKSPELAKRFSDKVSTTVNEMMERLDDFVRSEEAYASTELPKREMGEIHRKASFPFNRRDNRSFRNTPSGESRRNDYRGNYKGRTRTLQAEQEMTGIWNTDRYCDYHHVNDHYTNDYIQLRKQLEMALESRKLNHLVKDVRQRGRGSHDRDAPQPAKIINVISVNFMKDKKRKVREATESWLNVPISFSRISSEDIFEEPLIVEAEVEGYLVRQVYVDEGSSVEVMFEHCFENLSPRIKVRLKETQTDLAGFAGEISKPLVTQMVIIAECRWVEKKQMIEEESSEEAKEVVATEEVLVNLSFPDQRVTIGRRFSKACKDQLRCLLKDNIVDFAWEPSDMTGVSRQVIEHMLNVKRRTFSAKKSRVVTNEVAEWVKAGIVRLVRYPTYISNPVLVKKGDGTWRTCIDFKNLNSACSNDYYPLSNICKDEEKTAFYTDQGTYCYIKMPFGLKNIRATYQRLVDSTFQSQIGKNLEAYVDDMMIKSRDEKMLLPDIAETFDNLKKINMKLNPKKCSFGVEEGKFIGDAKLERKAQILAYFIVERPEEDSPDTPTEEVELPEPWILFTDESSCTYGSRAGLILTNPKGMEFTYALRFRFDATNNEAEYEALVVGLRITEQMGVKNLQANVDSRLVANQVNGTYVAKEADMIRYLEKVKALTGSFKAFSIKQVPRSENKKANALSKIASTSVAHLSKQVLVEELKEKSISEREILTVVEEEGDTWMNHIFKYLKEGTLPADVKRARAIKRKSWRFVVVHETLYKKSFLGQWLRCVGPLQANYILREIHEGSCSMHAGTRSVVAKALRTGYYWPTMHRDARTLIRACQDCQVHKPFRDDPFKDWCEKLCIRQHFASVKHPQTNGLVERANPSLRRGIKARLEAKSKNCMEELPHVLWAHRAMIKSSNGDTPFSLTYGTEVVIPTEIGMPALRTTEVDLVENNEALEINLDLLEERREEAAIREAKSKAKIEKYYNSKVRNASFKPGDLVYRNNDVSRAKDTVKLDPKWEGPYEVTEALGNGAYKLKDRSGKQLPRTWNISNLKKCYIHKV
uniref:Reverse transcriptase domain-containing protein n=1 Tax=Tanacetum cinerariifolium TaxID=118510 RepID=A0A699H8M8_TANCI|nr:reverse transcriptase domain-containing protein [Tanacetum cinerariifolium]